MPPKHPDSFDPAQERSLPEQLVALRKLLPYVWPADRPSYKLRAVIAVALVIVSQFILVGAPFFLGRAQDAVATAVGQGDAFAQVGLFIAFFVAGYGGLRLQIGRAHV